MMSLLNQSSSTQISYLDLSKQLVRVWEVHRGQKAKLDTGYLVIEEEWFPKK